MAALIMPPQPRKERVFRARTCHLNGLTENELRARYRFGQESINYLAELLKDDLSRYTNKATGLTVEQQIMIALRFYASGSFLQVIGDTLGYDKSTVSRVVDNVTNALLEKKNQFIQWPVDRHNQNRIRCGFYEMAHFPNVLGCIDCTHVRIQAPSEDEPAFVNRKGFHSINVQAVCDYEGKQNTFFTSSAFQSFILPSHFDYSLPFIITLTFNQTWLELSRFNRNV